MQRLALISVSDKSGIVPFVQTLVEKYNYKIIILLLCCVCSYTRLCFDYVNLYYDFQLAQVKFTYFAFAPMIKSLIFFK